MFISPISAINTNSGYKPLVKSVKRNDVPQPLEPSFKGSKGFIAGYGAGVIGTLLLFGATVATGGILPIIVAGGGLIGSGGIGYGVHKAEDAIKEKISRHK